MRIYIAGPITSKPKTYKKSFAAAEKRLKALGFTVINPAALDNPKKPMDWIACMKRDIPLLLSCEAIYMLNGWWKSVGATLEHTIAEAMNITDVDYRNTDVVLRLLLRCTNEEFRAATCYGERKKYIKKYLRGAK